MAACSEPLNAVRLGVVLIALTACGQVGSSDKEALEARLLQHVLAYAGSKEEFCAPFPQVLAAESGFEGVHFERLPGAHRVVLVNATGGAWRMVMGYAAMQVYSEAGFFTMTPLEVKAPDGAPVPAVAFELTRRGWEALRDASCFSYGTPKSVKIYRIEDVDVPIRVRMAGKSFLVHFLVEGERLPWADTQQFKYLSTEIFSMRSERVRTRTFLDTGSELLDEGAARAIASGMKLESVRAIRGAARPPAGADQLKALLTMPEWRRQLTPCLDFPSGTPKMEGMYVKGDVDVTATFLEGTADSGRVRPDQELALDFFRRLERSGTATATNLSHATANGEVWAGTRFALDAAVKDAVRQYTRRCIPLGEVRIDSLTTFAAGGKTGFVGWAFVDPAAPWAARLGEQFAAVATVLRDGFGVEGQVDESKSAATSRLAIQARSKVPQFGAQPKAWAGAFNGYSAERVQQFRERRAGPAAVDMPGYGSAVRFNGKPPCVSEDGATLASSSDRRCGGGLRLTRGYTAGKVYAEVSFVSESADGKPNTWTQAAFTVMRHMSSVSTGSASVSFVGSRNENRIRAGDLIGIAADLDQGVIYYRINGEWKTGVPGSGLGRPVLYMGAEYFIAASAQGGPKGEREAWTVNFGQAPFRNSMPEGYVAYGAAPSR